MHWVLDACDLYCVQLAVRDSQILRCLASDANIIRMEYKIEVFCTLTQHKSARQTRQPVSTAMGGGTPTELY